MITAMEQYSKKWRFTFNTSKTEIVVFGESTTIRTKNKSNRTWILNGNTILEKHKCEHVGIVLSGNFSSTARTNEAVSKGKEVVFSLMNVGVRPCGLNPLCAAELWRTVGLPKMLYGSELWSNLTQTDLQALDRVHRFAAKRAQELPPSTKSAAALGNLGLWSIDGYIDKNKLLFFRSLVCSSPNTIHKQLFTRRLTNYIYRLTENQRGFIPDITDTLVSYDLEDCLAKYLETAMFPSKREWTRIISYKIQNYQFQKWREQLLVKPELKLYAAVHNKLDTLELWTVAFRNPLFMKAISNTVNVLCANVPAVVL